MNMTEVKIDDLMVQILKFSIGEKTLTLDYKVTNPFQGLLFWNYLSENFGLYMAFVIRTKNKKYLISTGWLLKLSILKETFCKCFLRVSKKGMEY